MAFSVTGWLGNTLEARSLLVAPHESEFGKGRPPSLPTGVRQLPKVERTMPRVTTRFMCARATMARAFLVRAGGALRAERCHEVYREKASGKAQLEKAID